MVVTGAERTAAALAARSATDADLHELRLDALETLDDDVLALVRALGPRAVVTCRPAWAGGGWQGDEAARATWLGRAARAGAGWLDLELEAVEAGLGARLAADRAAGPCRLLVSHHAGDAGGPPAAWARRLDAVGAEGAKLVVPTPDARALEALLDLTWTTPLHVALGTGLAAAWTRLRPSSFGSAWTYVAADDATRTAPDQPTLADLAARRLREHSALLPLALLGGPNVARSPGPATYTALFAHLGLPFHYLALPAGALADGLRVGGRLGVSSFSVTMPFKTDAARAAARRCPWTAATGVANTLVADPRGRLAAWNTDAPAFLDVLGRREVRSARVLVLGGGATACSAAIALASAGARVTLAVRSPDHVAACAAGVAAVVPWSHRAREAADVIVNTTPRIDADLWPPGEPLVARSVLDLAFPADAATPLVTLARESGARAVAADVFWRAQGLRQLSVLTGHRVPPGLLAAEQRAAPPGPARRPTHARPLAVPGSKSETQRALVLAALAEGPVLVRGASPAADPTLLLEALQRLGLRRRPRSDGLLLEPAPLVAPPGAPLWCGDGATCVRFLAALALVTEGRLCLAGSGRLAERPLAGLLTALAALGVRATRDGHRALPLTLQRMAPAGNRVAIDARDTSQFASALMLVASRLPDGLAIETGPTPVSSGYLELTAALLRRFGVPVARVDTTWQVGAGPPQAGTVSVAVDWSLAAFWRVAERLLDRALPLAGLDAPSDQADARIDDLLAALDGPGDVLLDLSATPDLLPPLAVAALFAGRPVRLGGLAHARLKESDRLAVLARTLRAVGARVDEQPDGLWIAPGGRLHGALIEPAGDHRMAMAFGILGLRVDGITIQDRGVVAKSYPAFWDHVEAVRCVR